MMKTKVVLALLVTTATVLFSTQIQAEQRYNRKTAIVEAVEKTNPSIVTIKLEKKNGPSTKESLGTGVIVDERGYIVTNAHVTNGADSVNVTLFDGTELVGKVVKEDPTYDMGIIRVDYRRKLKALPLGPAGDLMVGETVIAIGHPFGYRNTVSTGIVSAVGRDIRLPTGVLLTNLIQTNASINPGNSGGPLLNINGELIGINVALRDGAQGIAFALNADTVQQVLSKHLSAFRVSGIQHGLDCKETVIPEGDVRSRVIVQEVAQKSPAQGAGLKPGDEIVLVADRSVANRFDLERAFFDVKPGEQVSMVIVRDGKQIKVPMSMNTAKR